MRAFLPLLSMSAVANALYFYIDGVTPKCFYEELPKDTLVVGNYVAEEYDERIQGWAKHDGLSIYISVDVCTFPWSFHELSDQTKQMSYAKSSASPGNLRQ